MNKNNLIINLLAVLVILLGTTYLTTPAVYATNTADVTVAATCECGGGEGDTCEGDRCKCNSDGTCSSCDRWLGIFPCSL